MGGQIGSVGVSRQGNTAEYGCNKQPTLFTREQLVISIVVKLESGIKKRILSH